jgi:TRAP-type uncharacterized transport system substrate-binding protein
MMSRVSRRRACRQARLVPAKTVSGEAQRLGIGSRRGVRLSHALALAFLLSAPAASAEDAAQSGKSTDAAQTQPSAKTALPLPPGMIRYDKPVIRNGKLVLWHGPGRNGVKAPATRPPAVAPSATFTVLVDSGDREARQAASEIAAVLSGAGAEAKPVLGRMSRAAFAKEVSGGAADFAVAPLDGLLNSTQSGPDWRRRIPYVARLYNEDIELIAPRAVDDLGQLAGRKVNVDAADSATATSAEIIFSNLKVTANWTNYPLSEALQRLARGEIDAILTVGLGNPDASAALGEGRFHILSIPCTTAMRAYYAPKRLTAADSPTLISADEKVDTVSAALVLVAIDGATPARADRLAPLADRFFAGFDQLLDDAKDARWRDVNLAATIDQLPRLGAAQAWLDQHKGETSADFEVFRTLAQAADASSEGPTAADSDRLYKSLVRLSGPGR